MPEIGIDLHRLTIAIMREIKVVFIKNHEKYDTGEADLYDDEFFDEANLHNCLVGRVEIAMAHGGKFDQVIQRYTDESELYYSLNVHNRARAKEMMKLALFSSACDTICLYECLHQIVNH